ncbi:MAG TPA: alpha/beta fold hydrolase, partial [Solimonas sp.]|nr:alpha/beta fold hydrolase [Solimonas sp.]
MPEQSIDLWRQAAVERIQCGDAMLPLRRYGSGPDLLLVHGFPLSGYTWRHVLPALAARHTCHVIDLAGLGESEWNERTDFSFEGHARRLKSLLDRIGVQRYDLLAQDTGATVTRCLALMDPARAGRQVMINT